MADEVIKPGAINPLSEEANAKRKATFEKNKAKRLAAEARLKKEKESIKMNVLLAKREAKHGIPAPGKAVADPHPDQIQDLDKLQAAAIAKLLSQIQAAREDPAAFAEFAIRDPQGNPLVLKEFQKEWLRQMAASERLVIEASRNHGKTTLVLAYCLWAIGCDPNIRIKFFCQNDKRAKERLFEIRSNIERNQAFKLVFPDIKPSEKGEWSSTRIVVERTADLKDATFEALGIETSATGGRATMLVCDDVCDLRSSVRYPSLRDQIIQKFMGEMLPILDPGGKIIYIATPWSKFDLTTVLQSNPEFKSLRYAIGNDTDPFAPLWPERWPREVLLKLRMQMGPVEFDRAYKCVAYSGDAVPCKPEWIRFYNAELLGDPQKLICIQAYDLAISQNDNADYFAGVTLLFDQERNLAFIADAFHDRLSFSAQAQRIIDNFSRWNADRVIIERVGLGGGLESYLRENAPVQLPIIPYKPKGDKQFRFMQVSPWFENSKVFFHPNMDPQRNVLINERGDLISELLEFPIGKHDDMVDSVTSALWGLEEFRVYDPEDGWMDGGGMRARMNVIG